MLAGLVVVQFFISTEVLAATALFVVLAVVIVALADPPGVADRARFAAVGFAVATAGATVVLAYPIYILLAGAQHISGSTPGFENYRSALLGPLLPTSSMVLSTPHLRQMAAAVGGNRAENGSYLGLPIVVLVVLGTLLVRRRPARVAGLLSVIAFVISIGSPFRLGIPSLAGFGSSVPLPATLLSRIPLLQDAYPVRYTLYVALFSSLVVAVALDAIRANLAERGAFTARSGVPAAIAVVALSPLLPAWPYPSEGPVAVPRYFSTPAVDAIAAGSVAVAYPWPDNNDNQAQLWQATAGLRFRMAGGYFIVPAGPARAFSYAPVTLASTILDQLHVGPPPAQTPRLRSQLRAQFGSWNVQSIVASPPTGASVAFFTWLTGLPPSRVTGGVAAWYDLRWTA